VVENGIEGQSLVAEDQLFILTQAGLYLTATRGLGAPEARVCYERAEPLCHSLGRPLLLHAALVGRWRYTLMTDKLSDAMQIAKRVYLLAQQQNDAALLVGAYRYLAATLCFMGDFESARQHAMCGVQIWGSRGVQSSVEQYHYTPVVGCLIYLAMSEWHLGEIASSQARIAEAIALARELYSVDRLPGQEMNDTHVLALALLLAGIIAWGERDPAAVDCLASELIELSTRHNFSYWLIVGTILRGWARSVSGDIGEGIPWIEDGISDHHASGVILGLSLYLALKAEALYLAGRTSEALEAITEAGALVPTTEERWWCSELHRLRGVFLTAIGADETQIDASFGEAIKIAMEQKSVSLEKRAEATYAEYRRQKRNASGGHGFRLPLW